MPDNIQYLVLYVLGLLKSPILSPPKHWLQSGDQLDYMNFMRFMINQMSPDETTAFFHPQIYCISTELTEECPPVHTYLSILCIY
ncbi:MAG: hypothetical protein ACMG6E_10275 [Candidatus Roizmanbacteria bacterium]